MWVRSLGQEDPLEEGMETHSRILAWRIPADRGSLGFPDGSVGKESACSASDTGDAGSIPEPGGLLQSIGSQRVRHY